MISMLDTLGKKFLPITLYFMTTKWQLSEIIFSFKMLFIEIEEELVKWSNRSH